MKIVRIGADWPEAVSDGLELHCGYCDAVVEFDYSISDELWQAVVQDDKRRGVVCLPCLDRIATAAGWNIGAHLIEVQYTGINKTIMLTPTTTYIY